MTNRQPIDVLFAISDTGGGHRSAAVAISAALELMSGKSITWAIEDLLQATNVPGIRSAPGIYDQLSTRWLKLYNFSFRLTDSQSPIPRLPYPPASPHCSNGEEVVQEYQPVVHRLRLSASA